MVDHFRMSVFAFCLGLGLLSGISLHGQTPEGLEQPLEGHPAENRMKYGRAVASNGDYLVAHQQELPEGAGFVLMGQRFAIDGQPKGPEFQLNSTISEGPMGLLGAVFESEERFLMVWLENESFVDNPEPLGRRVARWFTGNGEPDGPELILGPFEDTGRTEVALMPTGDFVVAFQVWSEPHSLFVATYGPDGTLRSPVHLAHSQECMTWDQRSPRIGMGNEGDFVVSWYSTNVFDDVEVPECEGFFARAYGADGQSRSELRRLLSGSVDDEFVASRMITVGERYLVAVTHHGPGDEVDADVLGLWVSRNGFLDGEPFQVNGRFQGLQGSPQLADGVDGEVFASWDSTPNPPDGEEQLVVRRLAQSCTAGPTTLCLGEEERFRVEVAWADARLADGQGGGEALTEESGYFWFFRPGNVELVVKVVDGRQANGDFWVFYGALSNVEYELTVTDTTTGSQKIYRNPTGQFASVGDTEAFPGTIVGEVSAEQASGLDPSLLLTLLPSTPVGWPSDLPGVGSTGNIGESLNFAENRFTASLEWRDVRGNQGPGHGVALTEDTGYFWFFNPDRAEVVLKVLDGRPINGHFWLFYGALSNVEYTLSVEDHFRGTTQTYFNPQGAFTSEGDNEAFP